MNHRMLTGLLAAGLCGVLSTSGCKSEPEQKLTQPPEPPAPQVDKAPAKLAEPAQPVCTYRYNPEATKLTWTAFKLTNKTGVPGTFKTIDVSGTKESKTPAEVFENLTFEIDATSISTDNPERDAKIAGVFFGKLEQGKTIRGEVKSLQEGKGTLDITVGAVTKTVELAYTVDAEDLLVATGAIDLTDFGAGKALALLNRVCKEQHTGEDKKSKLWPDVELKVESKLDKTCQ